MAIPDGIGNFTGFAGFSLDGSRVAFGGFGSSGQRGLYLWDGSSILKILDAGDLLDGRVWTSVAIGREGLSGTRVAFQARFSDSSQAVFVAEPGTSPEFDGHYADGITFGITVAIPEPGTMTLALCGVFSELITLNTFGFRAKE